MHFPVAAVLAAACAPAAVCADAAGAPGVTVLASVFTAPYCLPLGLSEQFRDRLRSDVDKALREFPKDKWVKGKSRD